MSKNVDRFISIVSRAVLGEFTMGQGQLLIQTIDYYYGGFGRVIWKP